MAKLNSTNVFGDLTVANDIDAAGEILEDGLPVATENYVSNNFLNQSDYNPEADTHSRYTDGEASSAAPVQSVNGQVGDVSIASLASSVEVISSSTTWNKPSGAKWIIFYAIGGGGGGGDGPHGGPGGGGGGGVIRVLPGSAVPSQVSITVGAGGSPKSDGGDTVVGNTIVRAGGGRTGQSGPNPGGYINGGSDLRTLNRGGRGGVYDRNVTARAQNSVLGGGGGGGGGATGTGESASPGGGVGDLGVEGGPGTNSDGADASAFFEAGEGAGGASFDANPASAGFPGGGGAGGALGPGSGADGAVKIAVLEA